MDTNLIDNVRFTVNEATDNFIEDTKINQLALPRARQDQRVDFAWVSHHSWAHGLFDTCLFNARFGDKQTNLTYELDWCGSLSQAGINTEFDIVRLESDGGVLAVIISGDETANPIFADNARVQIAGSVNNNFVFTVINTTFEIPSNETKILVQTVEAFAVDLDTTDLTGRINAVDSRDLPGGIVEVWGAPLSFKAIIVDVIQFLLLHKAKEIADFNGRPFHFVVEDLKKQLGQFKGLTSFG